MAQPKTLFPQLPRQLVRRLAKEDGETFASYIDRLAHLHRTVLGIMLSRLGLITADNQKNLAGYGVTLDAAERKRFALVTGLSEESVNDLLLSRFSPGIVQIPGWTNNRHGEDIRKASVAQWAYFNGSHFCPDCLRESEGVWDSRWKLPWSFACTKHGALLYDLCPSCQRRPRAGLRDGRLYPPFHGRVPTPTACNNALHGGVSGRGKAGFPCGCVLSELERIKATAETLAAQRRLDDAIAEAVAAPSSPRPPTALFSELRSVTALIMYGAEVEDFPRIGGVVDDAIEVFIRDRNGIQQVRADTPDGRNGPRQRNFTGPPVSASLMAALVMKALPILDAGPPGELREQMQALADRVRFRSPKSNWDVADYFQLSTRLRTALDSCSEARGKFDRRAGVRSTTGKAQGGYAFLPQHVPQLFPLAAYALLSKHFPKIQENLARRFCSMAAVKILGMTWAEAGRILELPATADRQANHLITQLGRSGQYDAFVEDLRKWAQTLSSSQNRTDYGMRRSALRASTDFPRPLWEGLCQQGGMTVGRNGSRSRYAAAWMWADATSGDWTLSPAFNGSSTANQRQVYKVMTTMWSTAMKSALQAEANDRISRYPAP